MKSKKLSLANIQGKLTRTEMKIIMAGCGGGSGRTLDCTLGCTPGATCWNGGRCIVSGGSPCCEYPS